MTSRNGRLMRWMEPKMTGSEKLHLWGSGPHNLSEINSIKLVRLTSGMARYQAGAYYEIKP
jgi:hypothetical protein